MDKFPKNAVNPCPYKKYPKFVQVAREIPNPIRNPGDLQKGEYGVCSCGYGVCSCGRMSIGSAKDWHG